MFNIYVRKEKGQNRYIPTCSECETAVIITKFPDGVSRFFCPSCKKVKYSREGLEDRRYSP